MTTRFADDREAVRIYAAAVDGLAARYAGTPEVFGAPAWRDAERAIDRAFASRNTQAFVAAVQAFEAMAEAALVAAGGDGACPHGTDPVIRAWRAARPTLYCARCFVEAGR